MNKLTEQGIATSFFPANIDLSTLNGQHTGFKLSGVAAATSPAVGRLGGRRQWRRLRRPDRRRLHADPQRHHSGASYVVFGKAAGFAAEHRPVEPRRQQRLQAQRRGGGRLQRLLGRLGRRRQRRRLRRPDHRRPVADPNGTYSGASYVVFGKAAGFAANLDLSSLDGSNGFKLSGVAADDFSGCSVASAGDVNGDGFDDLIVGAPAADPNGHQFRRELCGVRQGGGLRRQPQPVDPRRQQRLQAQRRGGSTTTAASRSPRRATSTATASTT